MDLVTISVAATAVLWSAGLWLFMRAELPARRKIAWVGVLVGVGAFAAVVLPSGALWRKFWWAMALVPFAGAADVLLFRSGRGIAYWVRACGVEVGTVFAGAGLVRRALDAAGIAALRGAGMK